METPDFTLTGRGLLHLIFPRRVLDSKWTIMAAVAYCVSDRTLPTGEKPMPTR